MFLTKKMAFPPSLPFVSFRLPLFRLFSPPAIPPLLTPHHFSSSHLPLFRLSNPFLPFLSSPAFSHKKSAPSGTPVFFLQNFPAFRPKAAPAPLLCVSSLQSRSCTPPHNSPAIKKGIPQTPLYSHIKNNVRRTAPMHVPASSAASRPEQRKYISAAKTYATA